MWIQTTRNISKMIEQRLSTLSGTEDIFDTHKAPYEKALKDSGYVYKCQISVESAYKLKYQKQGKSGRKRKPRKPIILIHHTANQ